MAFHQTGLRPGDPLPDVLQRVPALMDAVLDGVDELPPKPKLRTGRRPLAAAAAAKILHSPRFLAFQRKDPIQDGLFLPALFRQQGLLGLFCA